MVLSFENERDLEILKQYHKKEIMQLQKEAAILEHTQKMERRLIDLEIAKAGGKVQTD